MKKIITVLLALCLLLAITGCDGKNEPDTPSKNTYKVYFSNIKGDVYKAINVEEGVYVVNEEAPGEWGYSFVGWALNGELVKEVDVHENVTLKAEYEELPDELDFKVVSNEPEIVYLAIGETKKISYTITPDNYPGNIRFHTNDPEIVAIDEEGVVTAVSAGESFVSVMLANSADYILITVYDPDSSNVTDPNNPHIYTYSFGLAKDEAVTLKKGQTYQIKLKIDSNDPNVLKVSYDDYGAGIVSCSDTGLITALKLGIGQVYIVSADGKHGTTQIVYVDGYELEEHDANPGHEYTYGEYISTYLELVEYRHGKVTTENGFAQEDLKIVVDSGSEFVEVLQGKYLRVIKSGAGSITFHYESHGVVSDKLTVKLAEVIN